MVSKSVIGKTSYAIGKQFEETLKLSWRHVSGAWRLRIKDGLGSERPGDEIILLKQLRLLLEAKTTNKSSFNASTANLKSHQIQAGLDFDALNKNNYSVLFIQFNSDVNQVFAFHMPKLLDYLLDNESKIIHLKDVDKASGLKIECSLGLQAPKVLILNDFESRILKHWNWEYKWK